MSLFDNLGLGFAGALTLANIWYCFVGVLLGTAIGVLPGLGPLATIAMLLPITYALEPLSALIMLGGIYYGAQYGGSTTAILVNLPGESSSVVTCLDGHQMARRGRAGAALAIAALGSFFAGTVATFLIAGFAPTLATLALQFRSAEYFSLMVLGLVAAVVIANGPLLKAFGMIVLGLLLGLVGVDVNSGAARFDFGLIQLYDGIDFVVAAMGLFAFADIVVNARKGTERTIVTEKISGLMPTREDLRQAFPAAVRGTAIGSVLGLLPGGGALLSSFASYSIEKKISKHPETFGSGAIEGVAGPESANNAGAQASFIPMLTLGIPGNAVMALMMGAMMIHNVAPGPQVMTSNPAIFWGLIASMWIGNLMLLVINLPLISIWVWMLKIRYSVLYPIILVFCCIGLYSLQSNVFDIYLAVFFGVLGLLLYRMRCEPAPMLLGFILGPLMEENLRRALLISKGDPMVFITSPLSCAMLVCALLLLVAVLLPAVRRKRETVFAEEA